MHHPSVTLGLALSAALAAAPALAGTVEVRFDPKGTYTDVGATPNERQHHLEALAAHLRSLGDKGLAGGRTLTIELIDVDLAGKPMPSRRSTGEPRVVSGRADGPRIQLRYVLSEDGKELAAGKETLSDVGLPRLDTVRDANSLVEHQQEKRLLDHWFAERIARLP